jgi:GNAT superfamily N-acetyltransferase
MALFRETADVSVRPATAEDDAPIARVQLRAWHASHADVLGSATLEGLDVAAVRQRWAAAIASPPSARHRVLVACDGARVVGVAASAPVEAGVEVLALEVDPDHQRGGHGSRLLAACVDLARADGATHLQTWVLQGDAAREQFLASAGLGPDGARRELTPTVGEGADEGSVAEHRWVAEI